MKKQSREAALARREKLRALAQRIKERDDHLKKFEGKRQRLFREEVPLVIDALLEVADG